MRRWALWVGAVLLAPLLRASGATEAGLLEAWEALQRQDPKTVVFEKAGDRLYRFKTDRFPYDGKIHVLNLSITDFGAGLSDEGPGGVIGAVELELEGVTEDFQRKFATSYAAWDQGNRLFFHGDEGRWLTAQENFARWQSQSMAAPVPSLGRRWLSPILGSVLVPLILLVLLVAGLSRWQMRRPLAQVEESLRGQREALALARESLELQKTALRVLEQIRDGVQR